MQAETDLGGVLGRGRAAAIAGAIAGLASLLSLAAPPASRAAVGCTFGGGTMTVTVSTGEFVTFIRNGTDIEARVANVAQVCSGGTPTTTTTDAIVLDDNTAPAGNVGGEIDLTGGAFAPGATSEGGSTSEIEFTIQDIETLTVQGTTGADQITAGASGINLNVAAEMCLFCLDDSDATLVSVETLVFYGDNSGDVLSGAGGAGTGAAAAQKMFLRGEAGDDELTGGDGDDQVGDSIEPDDDGLAGGAGDDLLLANDGDDDVDGGAGADTATYVNSSGGVTLDLRTAGQQNTGGAGLDTLTGVENVTGSFLDDHLVGDDGANALDGSNGGDFLDPRGGEDTVTGDGLGQLGTDTVRIRDGAKDTATCGPLADTVVADDPDLDTVDADCETKLLTEGLLAISGKKRQSIRRRLRVKVSCPQEDCAGIVAGGAVRKRSTSLDTGESATLKLRLKRKARRRAARRLRRHRKAKVKITVTATDLEGNEDVDTLKVRLRR